MLASTHRTDRMLSEQPYIQTCVYTNTTRAYMNHGAARLQCYSECDMMLPNQLDRSTLSIMCSHWQCGTNYMPMYEYYSILILYRYNIDTLTVFPVLIYPHIQKIMFVWDYAGAYSSLFGFCTDSQVTIKLHSLPLSTMCFNKNDKTLNLINANLFISNYR